MKPFDLPTAEMSYLFGLLQTDGTLSRGDRNKGRLSLELSDRDKDILEKLQFLIPAYSSIGARVRDTNFKKDYRSSILRIYDQDVRKTLNDLGLPYGRKSDTVAPPTEPFSKVDYFRGLVDGDGSLGFTKQGFPFLSFCTSSKSLAQAYLMLILDLTGKHKRTTPTKRDGMFNPCLFKEDAQTVSASLYYNGCLALSRKIELASEVAAWARPAEMRKKTWEVRRWLPEEDNIVKGNPVDVAAKMLKRTEKSVRVRACRLRLRKIGVYPTQNEDSVGT